MRDAAHRSESHAEHHGLRRSNDVLRDRLLTDDHGGRGRADRSVGWIEVSEIVRRVHEDAGLRWLAQARTDLQFLTRERGVRGTAGKEAVPIVRSELSGFVEDEGGDTMSDVRQIMPSIDLDHRIRSEVADRVARVPVVVLVDEDEDAVRLVDGGFLEHVSLVA